MLCVVYNIGVKLWPKPYQDQDPHPTSVGAGNAPICCFPTTRKTRNRLTLTKCQCWPITLSQMLILAHCVFEFDTPGLRETCVGKI